ncbi:GNAT family N-acetyltransferase [Candidatus Bathyarchaeota archaeon]|nr:GNAT family N-acetyltransferase [Candidatus Bathyarchaeota archaeon]
MTEEFTLQRLETDDDVEQFLELMRGVFGQEDVTALVKKLINNHPTMTLKDFFAVKHRGKIVAGLNLIPLEWSIGGVPLKVAEMGCVATLPEYRHRGLQKMLVKEFDKRVAEQDYDLCAIEGIPYFYRQFGYEYALPLDEETRIGLDEVPDYSSKLDVRPFTNSDIPKAMELLAKAQSKFYVHSIRNEQIWKMQQETGLASVDKFESYAVEKEGQMEAFFRISKKPEAKELVLMETSDADHHVGKAILKFLKDVGKQHELDTLVSRLSHYNPLTEQLIVLGAVERVPAYAWQMRIVNYAKIWLKMKPLFEKHLAESSFSHLTEKLNFNFYRFNVQINVENGVIADIQKTDSCEDRTMRFNPLIFVKLLLGCQSLEELEMMYPDVIVRPSHKQLIDLLFPKLPSCLHCVC